MVAAILMLDRLQTQAPSREEAWDEVYRGHFRDLHRFVWRCGVSSAEAEDITQRAFVIAYERIDDLTELTSIGAWLRGIALRVVASHRRWKRVRVVKQWLVAERGPQPKGCPSPEQQLSADRDAVLVRELLAQMKPRFRDVLVLCDMEGLTPAEAAEILGVPTNTVRSRRRTARETFGSLWAKRRGGGDE